ncbi:hypothetical protein [Sphingomonas alpina]|uniref:Uncharacterized protein n=1 Tax=Sphingomonas alpina TaxID=653931 RepID=A0A7H0LEX9_9SPHN|nr:hypothetical protein [Sphingomonas alpina]QNQ08232.1 hypothetical protein H3Z74_15865 [Sphingomonas alpina]
MLMFKPSPKGVWLDAGSSTFDTGVRLQWNIESSQVLYDKLAKMTAGRSRGRSSERASDPACDGIG